MTTITIHDIPADLRARLEASAMAHGRTLNDEILAILQQAMDHEAGAAEGHINAAARIRAQIAASTGLPPVDEATLLRAKRSGRA